MNEAHEKSKLKIIEFEKTSRQEKYEHMEKRKRESENGKKGKHVFYLVIFWL